MLRALAVSLLLASFVLAGCAQSRPLTWRYELPAGLDPSLVIVARIRRGGCNDTDPVIYEARPEDPSRPTLLPPILDPDRTYCFDVAAEDPASGCAMVARSTIALVPGTDEPSREVVNVLETDHPRLATCDAPGVCTAAIGCLRCDEGDLACDGPPRCCPGIWACTDPFTLEEGTCDPR